MVAKIKNNISLNMMMLLLLFSMMVSLLCRLVDRGMMVSLWIFFFINNNKGISSVYFNF